MSLIVQGLKEALSFASGESEAVITMPGHGRFTARYWPKGEPVPEGWQRVAGDGSEAPAPVTGGGNRILIRKTEAG